MAIDYVYVLDSSGKPLMPTNRWNKVRLLLKAGKAEVAEHKPFTVRLLYEPETRETQPIVLGIDPGRTNIGLAAAHEDGRCLLPAHCETRNKEIPKLMEKRRGHRQASRQGERAVRKRLARKHGTTMKDGQVERHLPGYKDGEVTVKDIMNTEARFNNRKRKPGWLTPTATQLLRTHQNLVRRISSYVPVAGIALEMNRFAFMDLENGGKLEAKSLYQLGSMHGFKKQLEALSAQQGGKCLLCGKAGMEHAHHLVPKHKGGSDTLANKAGLCAKCHEKVHKDWKAKEKLAKKKKGINKKYGALSVLNQILPAFAEWLMQEFPGNVTFVSGYETKNSREQNGDLKDHCVDAYHIACIGMGRSPRCGEVDAGNTFTIQQFRRHNRSRINNQRERSYYLDGMLIAKNRKPRTEQVSAANGGKQKRQKADALSDWQEKMSKKHGSKETRRLVSRLKAIKSTRRYNDPARVLPGAECLYEGKRFILGGQQNTGDYYYPVRDKQHLIPSKDVTFLSQKGLVFL